jgi:alpha-L-rhamnosidase
MEGAAGERGVAQAACQVEVRDPKGALVWDSKKIDGFDAVHIGYAGSALKAATRYAWTVTVWTQAGAKLTGSSWFETGLMDPSPASAAWGGATWIGGGHDDLVLYSPYLAIFDVKYVLAIAQGSTRAGFVYGANDSRLMDEHKNIYQVESGKDQSYIKLELDISALGSAPDGKAKLHVYRAGYKDTDSPSQPLKTFEIDGAVINDANKHAGHTIEFRSAFGQITLTIDGSTTFAVAGGAPPSAVRAPPPAAAVEARAKRRQPEPRGPGRQLHPVRHAVRHGVLGRPGPARRVP